MECKIEQYKLENEIKISEEVLGLTPPVDFQCDKFGELYKDFNSVLSDINNANRALKNEHYDDVDTYLNSASYDVSDFEDKLQTLHNAIEEVRVWGQEWKDLAKRLINDSDKTIDELV